MYITTILFVLLIWNLAVTNSTKSYSRSDCFVGSGVEGDDVQESGDDFGDRRERMWSDYAEGKKNTKQKIGRSESEHENEEEDDDAGEDEGEEFEYEDRKKRSSFSISDSKPEQSVNITGKLMCRGGSREIIHVTRVVVGVSSAGWCSSRNKRCTEVIDNHPLMFSCEGEDESCDVSMERIQIPGCKKLTNFVQVDYECLPDDSRLDICHFAEVGRADSVIVTSPAYPWVPLMHDGEYLTCECEISTDDRSVITMEYIQSEMTGQLLSCDDEFLLVEKRDPRNKRKFKVEDEICGSVRKGSRSLDDSLIRLTYMAGKPNSTDSKRGFLAKFKALSRNRRPSRIQIKCEELSDDDNMINQIGTNNIYDRPVMDTYMTASKTPVIDTSMTASTKVDNSKLVNKTRPVTTATTTGPAIGSPGGVGAIKGGAAVAIMGGADEHQTPPTESHSGVLTGVIASLVSVIVIMGSLAIYFIHWRSIKSYFSWYRDPVYTDPVYTTSSRPPDVPDKKPVVDVSHYQEVSKIKSQESSAVIETAPPLPPKAPPRRKRSSFNEAVVYDNAPLTVVSTGAKCQEVNEDTSCYDNITDI